MAAIAIGVSSSTGLALCLPMIVLALIGSVK
jgi:hypothetical protein